ncbi:MAG: hypothetical protein JW750_10435 [Anaerolineaceae bacterium]|nr:hypothetical protein [Anaerolineaceae bacterium]
MMSFSRNNRFSQHFSQLNVNRNMVFGIMLFGALIFFELFNYSTTDFALKDILGDLNFLGIRWATTLSIAFCAIDFAGIARLFTPESGADEPKEIWYLFGAWLIAATMNAALTWWGVSMAIVNHTVQSTAIVEANTIMKVVPIFVAIMVWVSRVLIIGTFSVAGEKYLWKDQRNRATNRPRSVQTSTSYTGNHSSNRVPRSAPSPVSARPSRPNSNRSFMSEQPGAVKEPYEPTYESMEASSSENKNSGSGNSRIYF